MQIIFFGLGAIGSNLLLQLAGRYPRAVFTGIDFDKIEERNIATQAYLLPHIGLPKVQGLQIVLGMKLRRPLYKGINCKISSAEELTRLLEFDRAASLFIDCFDNPQARAITRDFAGQAAVPLLHIGFSPQYTAELIWDEEYSVPGAIPPDRNDICTMQDAVPFIQFVVSVGALLAVDFLEHGRKKSCLVLQKQRIQWL